MDPTAGLFDWTNTKSLGIGRQDHADLRNSLLEEANVDSVANLENNW